jgi:ABC-type amino acid transport substrate-binding protein
LKTIILKPSVFIFLVFVFMTPQHVCVQTTDMDQSLLILSTKESPPFSMKNENGTWTGISIELWRQIADKLDLNYQFKKLSIAQILEGVLNSSLDAGVAAFTITPKMVTSSLI